MAKDFNNQNKDQNTNSQMDGQEQYSDQSGEAQQQYDSNSIPEPQKKSGIGFLIFVVVVALVVAVGFKDNVLGMIEKFRNPSTKHPEITKPVESEPAPTITETRASTTAPSEAVTTITPTITPADKQEIENIIKEYIQKNPNVILESLKSMEQQMVQERSVKAQSYIKNNISSITTNKPYLGNQNGTVVITKFFDYKCGYCKKAHSAIDTLVKSNPSLKVVLIELPIMGQQSLVATQASLAVFNIAPTKFAKFNNDLMNTPNIDENTIKALATQNNINVQSLMAGMKSPQVEQEINSNMSIAREVGLQGVPAFIIGDEFIPGFIDYDTLKTKVEKLQKQYQRP
ncbi:MAG: thioredoxin domain-containing protein [Rickettsiales bacterium]|nr:thioredoxin domain-containing protein [Rickettsiales bacterium]